MSSYRRAVFPPVVGIGALLLVGCSPSHHQAVAGPASVAVVKPSPSLRRTGAGTPSAPAQPASAPALPILAYELTPAQVSLLDRATGQLIANCMARFGYRYNVPTAAESSAPSDPMDRRYGVMTIVNAENYGYHLSPSEGGGNQPTSSQHQPALSPAEQAVLTGVGSTDPSVPSGGCQNEARLDTQPQASQPDTGSALGLANQINQDSYSRSQTQPAVVAVFRWWSSCMQESGYSFNNPMDALSAANLNQPIPSASEVHEAVADMNCKTKTNLIQVWEQVEAAEQQVLIQKNIQTLTAAKARNDALIRGAADAVGANPP